MAFRMIPLALVVTLFWLARNVADATLGINWGRQNAQRLLPSNVVDLLLQNGVREARIFTSEEDLLRAFAGSGIGLTVSINGGSSVVNTYDKANAWVQMRRRYFTPSNIKRVYVADYVFTYGMRNKALLADAMDAVQSLQKTINDAGYGKQIKATIPHFSGILKMNKTSMRPSEAEFHDDIKLEMAAFVRYLQKNNAPFVTSFSPLSDAWDLDFAIPDNKSKFVVEDVNGVVYTNIIELMYDAHIWALRKLNASDIEVVVSQIGWPTDGHPWANASTAERFYKALLPWVVGEKGTHMHPGKPIDIFIHALTDENRLPYVGGATFARHWGIYRSNGKPKFKIDLSGQGRDVYPTVARGIMRMPDRWCLFNGNRSDILRVKRQFKKACLAADCTTLAPGASCGHLSFDQNVSYAFNMNFQFQYQNERACDFDGLAYVSVENPSTHQCVFPVEVVRSVRPVSSAGKGFHERANCSIFVFLLSILGILFWN